MSILGVPLVVWEVEGSLSSLRDYVTTFDNALPDLHRRGRGSLKAVAQEHDWRWEDYDCASQELDNLYVYSLPRLLTRSVVAMLYSALEVGLIRTCDHMQKTRQLSFEVGELAGNPLERGQRYLSRSAGVNITEDTAWQFIRDLQFVRNLIVHNEAILGPNHSTQARCRHLVSTYRPELTIDDHTSSGRSGLLVSSGFCKFAITATHFFFRRLFIALELKVPSGGGWETAQPPTDPYEAGGA